MRSTIGLIFLLFPLYGLAASGSGTITTDTSGDVEEEIQLTSGCGTFRVGNATSADFGSGTLTLKEKDLSATWSQVDTYTAVPDPNPEALNFNGVPVILGVSLGSSTSPDLYWEIREGDCR